MHDLSAQTLHMDEKGQRFQFSLCVTVCLDKVYICRSSFMILGVGKESFVASVCMGVHDMNLHLNTVTGCIEIYRRISPLPEPRQTVANVVGMGKGPPPKGSCGTKKKVRSHGTKEKPCCRICKKRGHYASKCPSLARRLLDAIRKTTNTSDIANFLSSNKKAHVDGMVFKPKRTLKKRARGLAWHRSPETDASRRKQTAKAKGMKRSPKTKLSVRQRPLKSKSRRPFTERETKNAYFALKKSGWAWTPQQCHNCGGSVVSCAWLKSAERGWGSWFKCFSGHLFSIFPRSKTNSS